MMRQCPICGRGWDISSESDACPNCAAGDATVVDSQLREFLPPSAEALDAEIPQYKVTEQIAAGGMGAVYRARQPELNRTVAIKVLPFYWLVVIVLMKRQIQVLCISMRKQIHLLNGL